MPLAARVAGLLPALALLAISGCQSNAPLPENATKGMVTRQDFEVVECLLPGQVRQLGQRTFLSPRKPVRTTTVDCRIRGGEYVAYNRADYKSALNVWMATAEAGDAEAQTNVGEIFERGLGGAPNPEAAAIWYEKAANQGNTRALFNLGTLYEQGLGVPQDRVRALDLYRQAWGIPADSLMLASVAEGQKEELRTQLSQALAEKDAQIKLLEKQLADMQRRVDQQTSNAVDAAALKTEVAAMRGLISRLRQERSDTSVQATSMTRSPGSLPAMPPMDLAAERQLVQGNSFGRFYAVVIGNQNYQVLDDLQTPRSDTERIAQLLRDKYGFTVRLLEDADDVTMLRALNDLNQVLKPEDNVLIYYAGHGTRLVASAAEIGYWMPVNAEQPPSDTFWIPNEQVTAHLARLPARRVLVIADSCYAGLLSNDPAVNLFGTESRVTAEYMRYKLPKRSRLLVASGGDRPVLDVGADGNSVFAQALLGVLEGNTGILSTPGLFWRVRDRVQAGAARVNFSQTPVLKAIKGAGHEVGDFFFVPKGM